MSRYYLKTTEARYVDAYKELRAMAGARYRFIKAKAQEWGFDEIGLYEFGLHAAFYKKADGDKPDLRGAAIEGFKGGERSYQQGQHYHRYELRQNNKRATQMRQEISAGLPPAPVELASAQTWHRPTISTAFSVRFGLPDSVFSGNKINYAQIFLLHDSSLLLCSLPYRDDDSADAAPPVFPEGFEEITERALESEISAHNKAIDAKQAGAA